MVLMKQTLAHQQQQTKYLQRQQAVAVMSRSGLVICQCIICVTCRIYVGCINYDTKEDSIKTAFLPFGPIRSITMSWDAMTGKHKVSPKKQFNKKFFRQICQKSCLGSLEVILNVVADLFFGLLNSKPTLSMPGLCIC